MNEPGQVLLFGANSMIGWSVFRLRAFESMVGFCNAKTRRMPAGVTRRIQLNDREAVRDLFAREQPALVIHCAGICDVDRCETSPEFAASVNVEGARNLVDLAPAHTRIVYCSSDHVFSGDTGPYDEASAPDPGSVYGRTRVRAEQLVLARDNTLVVRAGLFVGPSANGRVGHLDWLRYRHARRLPMTVVADEARSAVWAHDGAQRIAELARSTITGIRHIAATRVVPRPELADYLNERYALGAQFSLQSRCDRPAPHLGRVELRTRFVDALAAPLPSVVTTARE